MSIDATRCKARPERGLASPRATDERDEHEEDRHAQQVRGLEPRQASGVVTPERDPGPRPQAVLRERQGQDEPAHDEEEKNAARAQLEQPHQGISRQLPRLERGRVDIGNTRLDGRVEVNVCEEDQ